MPQILTTVYNNYLLCQKRDLLMFLFCFIFQSLVHQSDKIRMLKLFILWYMFL